MVFGSRTFVGWLAVLVLLVGCRKNPPDSSKGKASPPTRTSKAAKKALEKGAVKDGRGKWVKTKQPATRVVVAGTPLYSEVLIDLGAQDKLVAVTQSPNNPPSLRKLETIGRPWPLNIEKVLAAKPDLVLGTVEPYRPKLERLGNVPVYTGGSAAGGISSLQQIYNLIENVDRLVHHSTTRSALLIRNIRAKVKALQQSIPTSKPVNTAIVYMPKPQDARLYIVNKNSPAHELLTLAGGTNVLAQQKGFSTTVEMLIQKNPEVIVTDPKHVTSVLQHHALKSLRAIKNKRVVGIPAASYTSSRFVQALKALIRALHPKAKTQ